MTLVLGGLYLLVCVTFVTISLVCLYLGKEISGEVRWASFYYLPSALQACLFFYLITIIPQYILEKDDIPVPKEGEILLID